MPETRYAPKIAGSTRGSGAKRRIAACAISPKTRIAMKSAPARGSNPSSAESSAAAGSAASGKSVGIGRPRVVNSSTHQYAAIAATSAKSARLSARGRSEIPGTGAPVPGISLLPRALSLALFALVAAIAAYWCVLLFTTRGRPMPTLFPLAALPAAALLSALLGFDPRAGALFIAILVFGLIAHAAILRFAPLPRVLPAILGAYLVSGILAALLAIALVLVREPAGLYTIGHGRAIGTFVLPGELAGYLVLYVPVAFALTRAKALDLAPLAWTGVVLGALAFIMTFSRAGWVGMAAALAAFAILRRRDRGGVRIALAIGAAAVATPQD